MAQNGSVVILAFHTLNLVDQVGKDLEKQISEMKPSEHEIEVLACVQNTPILSPKLFKYFVEGFKIFVTVHNYLQKQGDLYHQPKFLLLVNFFNYKTFVFIDEGHVFLQRSDVNIPITYGFFDYHGNSKIVKSSSELKMSSKLKTYKVSAPLLLLNSEKSSEGMKTFQTPEFFFTGMRKTSLFSDENFRQLQIPPDQQNFNNSNKMVEGEFQKNSLQRLQNENFSSESSEKLESVETELFLDEKVPHFSISDEIVYENPYIICRPLVLKNSQKPFSNLKKVVIDNFLKIIHYNTILTIMIILNDDVLIKPFKKRFDDLKKKENSSEEDFNEVLSLQNDSFRSLLKAYFFETQSKGS